jgi:hypothetical protein
MPRKGRLLAQLVRAGVRARASAALPMGTPSGGKGFTVGLKQIWMWGDRGRIRERFWSWMVSIRRRRKVRRIGKIMSRRTLG